MFTNRACSVQTHTAWEEEKKKSRRRTKRKDHSGRAKIKRKTPRFYTHKQDNEGSLSRSLCLSLCLCISLCLCLSRLDSCSGSFSRFCRSDRKARNSTGSMDLEWSGSARRKSSLIWICTFLQQGGKQAEPATNRTLNVCIRSVSFSCFWICASQFNRQRTSG